MSIRISPSATVNSHLHGDFLDVISLHCRCESYSACLFYFYFSLADHPEYPFSEEY